MGKILLIGVLLLLGVIMLLVELLVLPGISVAGVAGFLLLAGAVFLSYSIYGALTGHIVLGITLFITVVMAVYALRARTWKRISLDAEVSGRVNTFDRDKIAPGDSGKALTRLNPVGKVVVNGLILEARSEEGLLDEGTLVEVVRLLDSSIVVKPKSEV